jgi:Kef-type K+ transport system membrane component KefB
MHPVTTTELFLVVLLLIFAVPYAVWRLTGGRNALPLVVVQIVTGILLGPGVAGALLPDLHAAIFTAPVIQSLSGVAWWGVILFVFLAGVELDLRAAWADRRATVTVAGFALIVPLALGTLTAALFMAGPAWIIAAPWQGALGIGMACAVTALPILILFLGQLGILREPLGQRVLRYASLDDVAIWAVLAIILLDWERVGRQVAYLALFIAATVLIRRLMARLDERDAWALALVWLIANAALSDWAGLHYMVGAFLAGLVLDRDWLRTETVDRLHGAVLLLLMPVFFLSTGLRTTWDMGGIAVIGAAAALLVAAVAGKLIGVAIAGRLLGWDRGEAWLIGWLLQTKALIMIVFANILLDRQVITADAFTALLLMAVASTLLTMPIISRHQRSPAPLR